MSPATATEQKVLEFGPLKKQLKGHLTELQSAQQTDEVRNAISVLETSLSALNSACGDSMIIPLTPRD